LPTAIVEDVVVVDVAAHSTPLTEGGNAGVGTSRRDPPTVDEPAVVLVVGETTVVDVEELLVVDDVDELLVVDEPGVVVVVDAGDVEDVVDEDVGTVVDEVDEVVGNDGGGGRDGNGMSPTSGNASCEQSMGCPVRPSTNAQYSSWHPVRLPLITSAPTSTMTLCPARFRPVIVVSPLDRADAEVRDGRRMLAGGRSCRPPARRSALTRCCSGCPDSLAAVQASASDVAALNCSARPPRMRQSAR
jgi:CBS domain-containing protein